MNAKRHCGRAARDPFLLAVGLGFLALGAQAAGLAAWPPSLAAGAPTGVSGATIADGIAVSRPGDVTFAHVQALVDEVVTVDEEAEAEEIARLLTQEQGKPRHSMATGEVEAIGEGPPPVPADQALTVMRILDAGLRSAAERREIVF